MKTEQEQIEKMARSMCGYCSTDGRCAVSKNGREPDICANVDTEHCLYKEYAERLIESGYGNISEHKAEIERLKANWYRSIMDAFENNRDKIVENIQTEIDDYKQSIKQAKIDMLNELKEKCKFDGHTVAVYKNDIDELIKEVQNAEDKG